MSQPSASPSTRSEIGRTALRIVLFGMPDAGKSSLLGALLQAGQTQEHLLDGRRDEPGIVEELPALSGFWEKYRNRGDVRLYAISVDKDWKTIEDFVKKAGAQLWIQHDAAAGAKRKKAPEYYE